MEKPEGSYRLTESGRNLLTVAKGIRRFVRSPRGQTMTDREFERWVLGVLLRFADDPELAADHVRNLKD